MTVAENNPSDKETKQTCEADTENLKEKNLEFFGTYYKTIHQRLVEYKPKSELIFLENGEPDVLFQGVYLYNQEGAYTHTRKQLNHYKKKPLRFLTGLSNGEKSDADTARFGFELNNRTKEEKLTFETEHPTNRAFFLHVMGIGLGVFLRELLDETESAHVTLYELNFELFYQSLSITDWAEVTEKYRGKDCTRSLRFVFDNDETSITGHVSGLIRRLSPAAADGLMIYQHYPSSIYLNAIKALAGGEFEVGMLGLGFFEDEFNMVSNAYENLSKGKSRIFKQNKEYIDTPVFICANGPSLDSLVPFIKKNQKRAIIISCGSTLDPLLANDIKPDFHVMIERSSMLVFDQQVSSKKWDIKDICFVGGTNVFPGVREFHKESILFFRGGISPKPLLATDKEQSPVSGDPLVANAALAFALSAGFKNVYFCGVDAGARDPNYHHSKDSQYTTRKINYNFKFDKTAPGNFGGQVRSTSVLLWSKKHLEIAIKSYFRRHSFYNLSDGVLIKGATPKHFSKVEIPALTGKKKLVKKVIEHFPVYTKEMFEGAWTKARVEERLVEVKDQMIDIITNNDLKEFNYLNEFTKILKPGEASDGIAMIYRGTVHSMLMHIFTHMERCADAEDKSKFEELVKEIFPKHVTYMCEEFIERIQDLHEGRHEFVVGNDMHWKRPWQADFIKEANIKDPNVIAQYLKDHDINEDEDEVAN